MKFTVPTLLLLILISCQSTEKPGKEQIDTSSSQVEVVQNGETNEKDFPVPIDIQKLKPSHG